MTKEKQHKGLSPIGSIDPADMMEYKTNFSIEDLDGLSKVVNLFESVEDFELDLPQFFKSEIEVTLEISEIEKLKPNFF